MYFEFPNGTKVKNDNIRLKIYTPVLSNIDMSGDTEVYVGDGFSGPVFDARLSGNSLLRLGSALYNNIVFDISGSGKIMGEPWAAKDARVTISGSATVEIRASQTLHASISGSGVVHYWGNPSVTSNISGSGSLVRH